MVKGKSRRVIVVPSPDKRLFEEAIFFVNEDMLKKDGVSAEMVVKEAQQIAERYVKENFSKRRKKLSLSPVFYCACGVLITGLVWVITNLI